MAVTEGTAPRQGGTGARQARGGTTDDAPAAPPQHIKGARRERLAPYLYIAPFFVLFAIFGLFPMVFTGFVSLNSWNLLGDRSFIGLENYSALIGDPAFLKAVFNTFSIWFLSTVPQLILALILASVLNDRTLRGRGIFRMGLLVPNVTSTVAVAIVFDSIFGANYGIINYLIGLVGIDNIDFKASTLGTHVAIATMIIWRWTGYNAIIYLAGLQAIPRDVYEAASIDGASKIQRFRHVTIPLLRPVILFTVILSTIGGMQIFAEPLFFSGTGGGGAAQGLTLTLYLYEEAFRRYSFGYASAIAVVLFGIIVGFAIINFFLTRRIESAE